MCLRTGENQEAIEYLRRSVIELKNDIILQTCDKMTEMTHIYYLILFI